MSDEEEEEAFSSKILSLISDGIFWLNFVNKYIYCNRKSKINIDFI